MTASKAVRTVATMFTIPAAASAELLSAIWRLDRHPGRRRRASSRPVMIHTRLAGAP